MPKGKPLASERERLRIFNVRLTAAQVEKIRSLGGVAWLRRLIDETTLEAVSPTPAPSSLERGRAYYEANKDMLRAKCREWARANPESARVRANRRRALVENAHGRHTSKDIADLRRLQRGLCAYCRTDLGKTYHADHIQPLSKGGANDKANLQLLCPPCNLSKGAKDPVLFAQERGLLL